MASAESPFLDFDIQLSQGDFDLDVAGQFEGGITAVFGPSGAGKSTLLGCLAGMITPDQGYIKLGGETLYSSSERIRRPAQSLRTAIVFQDGMLFPHKTVRQNIQYGYNLTPPDLRTIDPSDLSRFPPNRPPPRSVPTVSFRRRTPASRPCLEASQHPHGSSSSTNRSHPSTSDSATKSLGI